MPRPNTFAPSLNTLDSTTGNCGQSDQIFVHPGSYWRPVSDWRSVYWDITSVQLTYRSLGSSIASYHNYKTTNIVFIFHTGSRDSSARSKTLPLFTHPHVIPNWKDFCELKKKVIEVWKDMRVRKQ